jgi:hypothetical protein
MQSQQALESLPGVAEVGWGDPFRVALLALTPAPLPSPGEGIQLRPGRLPGYGRSRSPDRFLSPGCSPATPGSHIQPASPTRSPRRVSFAVAAPWRAGGFCRSGVTLA